MRYICLAGWEGLVPIGNIHLTVLEELGNIGMPPTTPVVVTSNITDRAALDGQLPKSPTMAVYAEVPDDWSPPKRATES